LGGEGKGRDIAHFFDPRRWGADRANQPILVGGSFSHLASLQSLPSAMFG
jgi:hypothetical protein